MRRDDARFTSCRSERRLRRQSFCDVTRQEKAFYHWLRSLPTDCGLVLLEAKAIEEVSMVARDFPRCRVIRPLTAGEHD